MWFQVRAQYAHTFFPFLPFLSISVIGVEVIGTNFLNCALPKNKWLNPFLLLSLLLLLCTVHVSPVAPQPSPTTDSSPTHIPISLGTRPQ